MRIFDTARIAGLLYLVVVLTGLFSLAYVPSRISVEGDMAATIMNIRTLEPLYRAGIAASMICYVAFLLLPLAMYRLFAQVNTLAAQLMLIFATASVPMALLNLARRLDILRAVDAGAGVTEITLISNAYSDGLLLVQLFWGLWLIPLGYLIVRAAPIPRLLGVLLILGGAGYLIKVFGQVLEPGLEDAAWFRLVTRPAAIGEIGTCLWLLLFGVSGRFSAAHGGGSSNQACAAR